jgi:DNA-binding beta-propeller fold protein YncE
MKRPSGLAVRSGTVVVADTGNARVVLFDTAGTFLEAIPVAEWVDPATDGTDVASADVAIDDGGTIWASSPATNSVIAYRPDGTLAGTLAVDGAGLDRPSGLALRPGGSLFVVNTGGHRVSQLGSIYP